MHGHEAFTLDGLDLALLVASTTATYASALWVANPSPVQQVAMVAGFAVTSSVLLAGLDLSEDLPGLGA